MPFAGFDDWDACVRTMTEEEGHDEESANSICGALQAEAKADTGNVEELRDALTRGKGLVADVGVELLSGVDVPAIDSEWVMFKSAADDPNDFGVRSPIVLSKEADDEKRISYAAAMIPRELDKEGDVVPTPTVEKAAHNFLKGDGGVDTDHSLIDGEGEPVESWVLKQERSFDLPGGDGEETYPAGTWMVGIEWGKDAWERIQAGELTGLSIYGRAERHELQKSVQKDFVVPYADESVVNVLYASRSVAAKAAEAMGFEGDESEITHPHAFGDQTHYMPAPSHDEYVDAYNEFAEADEPLPDMSGGDTETEAASKDDADPCWDGHTMVGTKPNGNPRCVPDDEIDDVDFDKAVEFDKSGATPKSGGGEGTEQEPTMSDPNDPDGGDGAADGTPDTDLTEKVDSLDGTVADLTETVEEMKAPDGPTSIESADPQALAEELANKEVGMDTLVDLIAEMDDVGASPDEVADTLAPMFDGEGGEPMEAASDGDDDGEDEETEKSADGEPNFSKSASGRGSAAAANGATGSSGVPSYRAAAEQHEEDY